jgi:DNA-binding NarL/FixJ family response regulator
MLSACIHSSKKFKLLKAFSYARDALNELPGINPDLVLMDIKLPGMSGITCLRELRALSPPFASCVLIMTDYEDDNLIFDALKAGAAGYLSKRHTGHKELETAMRDAMAGGSPMSPGIARKVFTFFQTERRPLSHSISSLPAQSRLTARQTEVLQLLGRGHMHKEMAATLGISVNGIRKHVQSIYRRLHVRSRSEAMLHCLAHQETESLPHYTKM